jgi:hypothetical protein
MEHRASHFSSGFRHGGFAKPRASRHSRERLSHTRARLERLLEHERRVEPQHAIPPATQSPIATRIGSAALGVIPAIDLDDPPSPDGSKVRDEATQRNLPPKPDTELPGAKQGPERPLGRRGRRTHGCGARDEYLVSSRTHE